MGIRVYSQIGCGILYLWPMDIPAITKLVYFSGFFQFRRHARLHSCLVFCRSIRTTSAR